MSQPTSRLTNPEEEELTNKKTELLKLESVLADKELKLTELRFEFSSFERTYLRIVGKVYAELDEIEAKIAEEVARTQPASADAQNAATQARDRASASRSVVDKSLTAKEKEHAHSQSQTLKTLYREVAKRIHPDLATDSIDRERRQRLMAEANRAYEEGDEGRLRAILEEYELSPESVTGTGTAYDLVRVIRQIAQVKRRLRDIEEIVRKILSSETAELKARVEDGKKKGHDVLAEMAESVQHRIEQARERLVELQRVNA